MKRAKRRRVKREASSCTPSSIEAVSCGSQTLKRFGGSQSDEWNRRIVLDTLMAVSPQLSERDLITAIAGLGGIAPRDELESMMAAQLIAAHSATMQCYHKAATQGQRPESVREYLNQANKLSRTFAVVIDALHRHRGRDQKVIVEKHVYLYPARQTVVGIPEVLGEGDVAEKLKEQPHAKQIAHAPEPTMRSQDEERPSMRVSGDAERSLPDARRDIARSTEEE